MQFLVQFSKFSADSLTRPTQAPEFWGDIAKFANRTKPYLLPAKIKEHLSLLFDYFLPFLRCHDNRGQSVLSGISPIALTMTSPRRRIFLWTNVCRKKCRRQLLRSDNPVYVDLFLTHFNINFKQKPCQNFGKITPVLPARGRPYLVHHITPPPITICMNCKMRLHTELT